MATDSTTQIYRHLYQTINVLSSLFEASDSYTFTHQNGVSEVARYIGEIMGLAKDKIDCLRICGTIHDIGKVAIPAQILSKPGPLSPEEYSLVKTHSKTGYTILEKIDFPWPVADIVCQHHERLDGSGYPFNLTDKNILIEAKILAVADVFEAMTVARPYRGSLGIQGAVDELQENRGTLYDSDVVDSLISLISNHKKFFVKRKQESLAPVVQAIMSH